LGIEPDDDVQIEQVRSRTARFLQLIFVGAANWNR
jgi:TetR/AcrR family transcriptional regulator, fatty acid biosynthesis regulator